jgi:hypothetical protein
MKYISLALILTVVIILAISCHQKSDESCEKPTNPNGDSELALLMRDMTAHVEEEKKRMDAGKAPGEMPVGYDKISTAKPTDSKQLTDNFQGFATIYLQSLGNYHNATPENYRTEYNNLIKSCISCHEHECPGPIKRIEKLLVTE